MRGQKYNPPERVNPLNPKFKKMKKSVQTHGIVQPLVLTSDFEKVDGHVRSAVGTSLGLLGAKCHIAPFDSNDPRADLLYKLINEKIEMPIRQKMYVRANGGLGDELVNNLWDDATRSLGTAGYYFDLWKAHKFVPQLWKNCKAVANLVFNNGIVRDRKAREDHVHRTVMKWQCTGVERQQALKIYCTKIKKGYASYTPRKLWSSIESGEDIEV
jgi:hypothetical protein